MKLKEYLSKLNKLAEERPEILEFEVVTSKDDEGNGFNPVVFDSSVGKYEDGYFYPEAHGVSELNSVCVN